MEAELEAELQGLRCVGSSNEVARLRILICNVGISNLLNLELMVSGFALKSFLTSELRVSYAGIFLPHQIISHG